jgi:hypothetical protein
VGVLRRRDRLPEHAVRNAVDIDAAITSIFDFLQGDCATDVDALRRCPISKAPEALRIDLALPSPLPLPPPVQRRIDAAAREHHDRLASD